MLARSLFRLPFKRERVGVRGACRGDGRGRRPSPRPRGELGFAIRYSLSPSPRMREKASLTGTSAPSPRMRGESFADWYFRSLSPFTGRGWGEGHFHSGSSRAPSPDRHRCALAVDLSPHAGRSEVSIRRAHPSPRLRREVSHGATPTRRRRRRFRRLRRRESFRQSARRSAGPMLRFSRRCRDWP